MLYTPPHRLLVVAALVTMQIDLTNGTDQLLTGLRVQVCAMLKGMTGFNAPQPLQSVIDGAVIAVRGVMTCLTRFTMVSIVAVLVAAIALSGCGGNPNAVAKVEGDVKFDGQPIEKGSITFLPTDGKGATVGAEITAGKFSLLVPPGPKRIEVHWPRIVAKQKMYDTPDSPTVEVVEKLIPPVYNIQSTLTQDIAMPKTRVDLDLQAVARSVRH